MLGGYLRDRYAKLLAKGDYLSNIIRVQSTDTERTLSSVEANLAGFLSFASYRLFDEFLHWQPIPVEIFPATEDHLLATTKQCDRFDYEMVEYFNENNNYRTFWRHFSSLVDYLEKNSGIKANTILDLLLLYDALNIEQTQFNRYVSGFTFQS